MNRWTLISFLCALAIASRLSYKIGEARGYNEGIRKIQPEPVPSGSVGKPCAEVRR